MQHQHQSQTLLPPLRSPVPNFRPMDQPGVTAGIGSGVLRPKMAMIAMTIQETGGTEECRPFDPMFLRGWKPCFRISNCTVENQAEDCQLPKTMQEAIEMATELMDMRNNTFAERQAENKRKFEDTPLITKTNNRTKCKNTGGGLCCGNCEQETDRPHTRQVNFQPRSIPGAAPVARAHLQSDCPIKNKELAYQLQELSDKGFIRPSSSPWGAQFLFVMKEKMDSLRMCMNIRTKQTIR
ncbi:hypothetical protein Tco_0940188 [Tanacetum coccineum]|uniref:Reverse transcriptase domain-containing protein n=1 Tax=Tanacetum coccineum TaxID=301880 RepID=A0ABQ5DNZ4_9ASTR